MQVTDFSQPTPLVVKATEGVKPGRALDAGAAEGRNSLYLARQGWEVVATDIEQKFLDTLDAAASAEKLPIQTVLTDVRTYNADAPFELILSLMVLHFLPEADIENAVKKMQGATNAGGLNIISAFTSENPEGTRPYLFKPNQLKELYADWEIQGYEEAWSSPVMVPGKDEPQRFMAARLIAKRT